MSRRGFSRGGEGGGGRGRRNGHEGGGHGRSRGGRRHGGDRGGRHEGGGRGGRGRFRGGRRDANPRQSSESGNARERIAVESGSLVLIDQFMLANPQFITRLKEVMDSGVEKKDELIKDYGGCIVELAPGTYKIDRDPFAYSIAVHPDEYEKGTVEINRVTCKKLGQVLIDTRCLAMVDRELLDDQALLEKYQQLWFSGQDKLCRDLIRDNGGAVRYGFNRNGDDLAVFQLSGEEVIYLWPESIEAPNFKSGNFRDNQEVEEKASSEGNTAAKEEEGRETAAV